MLADLLTGVLTGICRSGDLSSSSWSLFIVPLFIALVLAVVDWVAVAQRRKGLEYVFKPATLVAVIVGAALLTRGPHDAWQARFFLPGLVFSLAGDVFLMLPEGTEGKSRPYFLLGLVSFLLGHVCYVIGLNPTVPPALALVALVAVAAIGVTLYRAIAAGLHRQSQEGMKVPVAVYSVVLSLTLFSAWATLFRPEWTPVRRGLVIVGASLFFGSDAMLAWGRFVRRSSLLHFLVIVTYHLGQMALAASIALW